MLKDDDIMTTQTGRSGEGNAYSTLYRGYNSRFGRWFSLDPLAAEFAWSSPYVGMGANPISLIDPLGSSTITAQDGTVEAVYDDDDLSVYRKDDDNLIGPVMPGYGLTKMGETWTPFGFADFKHYEDTGEIIVADGAKINFDSEWISNEWATYMVQGILDENPNFLEYAIKARYKRIWDIKNNTPEGNEYYGSLLFGKYASARDAGNFAAGAIAQSSILPNAFFDYGFGVYNMSENNVEKSFLIIGKDISTTNSNILLGISNMIYRAKKGEDKLTRDGIEAGKQFIREQKKE